MKTRFHLAILLCIILALTSCDYSGVSAPSHASPSERGTSKPTHKPGAYDYPAPQPKAQPDGPEVYEPREGMTPQETMEAYFETQYRAYASLEYIDTSALQDMTQSSGRNAELWYEMLVQRRRIIKENDFCYVDTEIYPYTINYIEAEELEDDRINFWRELGLEMDGEVMLHFVITGEPGIAYPPMMAVNTQHTVRMREVDGFWKVIFHYYPGSVRRYRRGGIERQSEEEMRDVIADEFEHPADITEEPQNPARSYNGVDAAWYAVRYAESPNPNFYLIGDWMGNCANFTSQCMWFGFAGIGRDGDPAPGRYMTSNWYAGDGGGSPAWENTEHFWKWATSGGELKSAEIYSLSGLKDGDMLQVRTGGESDGLDDENDDEEDRYNHSLIVVNADTLLLAQNSPGCFVYYCDLLNVETRMLRPLGLG